MHIDNDIFFFFAHFSKIVRTHISIIFISFSEDLHDLNIMRFIFSYKPEIDSGQRTEVAKKMCPRQRTKTCRREEKQDGTKQVKTKRVKKNETR